MKRMPRLLEEAFRQALSFRKALLRLCGARAAVPAWALFLLLAFLLQPAAAEPIADDILLSPAVSPAGLGSSAREEVRKETEAGAEGAPEESPGDSLAVRRDDPFSLALPPLIRVGIQQSAISFLSAPDPLFIEKTKDAIRKAFGKEQVDFRTMSRGDLASAVRSGEIDIVIGEADFIAQSQMDNNLRLLASLWPAAARDVNSAVSAVFFVKAESLTVQSLSQMGNHPVAASNPASFAGYILPLYELSRRGYSAGFLSELYFSGSSEGVVSDVLSGKAAVGILPACVLESMEQAGKIHMEDFRIINPRRVNELKCAHSADVFPSVTVAALPKTDPMHEKAVMTTLLEMPAADSQPQWGLPASMQKVFDLFYELKIGPYQYLAQWSLQRFMRENSGAVAIALILTIMILSYAAMLQMMVKKRTEALRQSLEERERIEAEVTASREHISALERTGIIGQMSSMIAHELKQPLGAINNFGNGLLRRVARGQIDPSVFKEALEEIVGQGTRAAEIVDRIRSYAKHPEPVMQVRDMRKVLEKAITEFRHSHPEAPPITLHCSPGSWAEVDSWEIQLAVINLLKNASEALQKCPSPAIVVSLKSVDGQWHLSVADNGKEITKEKTDLFFEPLHSGKISGMGLGLSIVANIAERHKGHAFARPNDELGHGCIMEIVMPMSEAPGAARGTVQKDPASPLQ